MSEGSRGMLHQEKGAGRSRRKPKRGHLADSKKMVRAFPIA